jgi:hypothetical protein
MQSSRKISSFTVCPREDFLFAGNLRGEVLVVQVDDLVVVGSLQVHVGAIEVVAAHQSLPYVAAMSMDRSVSLIDVSDPLRPTLQERFVFRDIKCWNDEWEVAANHSLSQALTFHPTERRLAVRSGNAGVLELDFSGGSLKPIHCTRLHGDTDLVTLRYVQGGEALLSGAGGDVVLSRNGHELRRWNFGNFNNHWFEPVDGEHYLIACDELFVIRIDLSDVNEPVLGGKLTRDDLEHVTYNRATGRAFAAGFDGDVYEIDPANCSRIGVAWRAPYKLRWIKTLEREPATLLAYCFNGGIYKVNLDSQRIIEVLKHTPHTIWTALREGDRLLLAGEGDVVRPVDLTGVDPRTGAPIFTPGVPIPKGRAASYTKRMAFGARGLVLGQRLGEVWEIRADEQRLVVSLEQEIRDLATVPGQSIAYVCTERGRAIKLDIESGTILGVYESERGEPLWSLAYNQERDLLATAERRGELIVIDCKTMKPVYKGAYQTGRPKRMKWCGDVLLFVQTGRLLRFDLASRTIESYIADCENTIEDFIWDDARQYLVVVGYRTEVVLCDFRTGAKLSVVPDQADFTKGLAWVAPQAFPGAYPLDFVTFGRSGTGHLFRIHNERLLALGPIAANLLGPAS